MTLTTTLRRGTQTLTEFVWPARAEDRSIPVLDGGLSPNDALDSFRPLWDTSTDLDDIASLGSRLVVSHGSSLTLLNDGASQSTISLPEPLGALARLADDRVLAVTVNGPIYELLIGVNEILVERELPGGIECPTAAVLHEGRLLVAEGSQHHVPAEWARDLMTKGSSGRVVEVEVSSGEQRTLVKDLAWAGGLAVLPDGDLLVSESWRHRIVRVDQSTGAAMTMTRSLAGYPTRMSQGAGGDILVAFLSLRTHLVEFVLREDEFRAEMVRTIAPEFWISPAHRTSGERWEPLQIGSIKHLNVTKPWAPPRAYGLVASLNAVDGEFTHSWHARVGSARTGATAVTFLDGCPVVVSRGSRSVLIGDREGLQ